MKLTPAQLEVLRKMNEGGRLAFNWRLYHRSWIVGGKIVNYERVFIPLLNNKLIKRQSPVVNAFDSSEYILTPKAIEMLEGESC